MLCNRFVYPKTMLNIAKDRTLTREEAAKAAECLEEALEIVNCEVCLMLWKLTDAYYE